jgi:ribosomal protein S18 acetylase RimI-like enzyme
MSFDPTAAKYPSLVVASGVVPISLRPAVGDDRAFLLDVYGASRAEELTSVPWSDEQKAAFVAMQFDAQDRYYADALPSTQRSVVLLEGHPIGRLYVDIDDARVLIVDVVLLPEHRGRGIGSALLAGVLAEADRRRLPTRLHVEPHNRAHRLYRRFGFKVVEPGAVYDLMERPWSTSPP